MYLSTRQEKYSYISIKRYYSILAAVFMQIWPATIFNPSQGFVMNANCHRLRS